MKIDAKPGRGWLVWKSNVKEIHVAPGLNPLVEWTVRDPLEVAVRVSLGPVPPAYGQLPVLVRIRTANGVTVDEDHRPYAVDPHDRLLTFWLELVPGAYEVAWRLPTGREGSTRIEVPEGAEDLVLIRR